MPHVIYLHSALTRDRFAGRGDAERRGLLRVQRIDVVAALGVAGAINLAMILVAASLFRHGPAVGSDPITSVHDRLGQTVGGVAALAFAAALLASGLSSSSVGMYAGQVVMQGFIRRNIPVVVRRAVTMTPALIVLACGLPPTDTLVVSQVVLSVGIPFALVPLALLGRRVDVMGVFANRRAVTVGLLAIAATVTALNLVLFYDTVLT